MQRIGLVLVMTLALLVAVAAALFTRVPDVVKIGVGQPLSGPLASQGQDLLHGVQLAVEEINAAGGVPIGGKRVKLAIVSADDKSNPADGMVAAQQLVDEGVLVAVAHLNSGVSIPTAPIYAQAGIAQLAISTKPDYTRLKLATTLRLVANDDLQSKAIGSYALQMPGIERIAVVDDGTPYGKGLADQVTSIISASNRRVEARLSLDNKTTDFGDLVSSLKRTETQLIVTTLSDFQVLALIKQLSQAGLSRMRILGGDTLKTNALFNVRGQIAGVYATSPILEAHEFPQGKAFLERFRHRFKGEPVYGAHYAYDAVYLVADAMTRNASVNKADLLAKLKSFDGNAPVTGMMRFDAAGEQRYGVIGVYELVAVGWGLKFSSDRW
jgi:branched-chain amino acid transport system substrate-binding protein